MPVVVTAFLVVALDGGLDGSPILVVDEVPVVVFAFCRGIRGCIGLTRDVTTLEATCFLGEIAFVVALDLTGRAVNAGFVTVIERTAVLGRVAVVVVLTAEAD